MFVTLTVNSLIKCHFYEKNYNERNINQMQTLKTLLKTLLKTFARYDVIVIVVWDCLAELESCFEVRFGIYKFENWIFISSSQLNDLVNQKITLSERNGTKTGFEWIPALAYL